MRFTVSNNLQGLLVRQISLNLLLSTYPRQGHKVGPDIRPLNSLSENTNNAYVTSIPAGQCWWIYCPSTPPSSHMCPLLSRHHVPRFCSRLQCLCSLSPVSCVFFSRFSPTLLSSSYPQTVSLNSVTDYFMWSPIPGVAAATPHYREPHPITGNHQASHLQAPLSERPKSSHPWTCLSPACPQSLQLPRLKPALASHAPLRLVCLDIWSPADGTGFVKSWTH